MCQINNVRKETNKKPLTCYKVVELYGLPDGTFQYISPFYCHVWRKGEKQVKPIINFFHYYGISGSDLSHCEIHSGFYHMFKYKEDAEKFVLIEQEYRIRNLAVIEVQIPPETVYYEGDYLYNGGGNRCNKSLACSEVIFS